MSQNVDRERATPSVAALRTRKPDGTLYERPKEVEETIAILSLLPASELAERACIEDANHPDYVPSECVLYFIRRPAFGEDNSALRELFVILRQRVLRAVPVLRRRLPGSKKVAESAADLEIQEAVLHKFQELLCGEYDERLDFYECRFNRALALLRSTARRDVRRELSHFEPMALDGDSSEFTREVEMALAASRSPAADQSEDFLFRSKLHVAISSLPAEERRVVELLREGMPIDSKDTEVLTITKVVGCTEKTVRNRRDRAYAGLRDALKGEDHA